MEFVVKFEAQNVCDYNWFYLSLSPPFLYEFLLIVISIARPVSFAL
ncbi:hypothetical protein FHW89_002107 [Mucilaginibacter sp. SG564]|nr:hypothetical protein [Mucilaginibacter sp. SG564]